MGSGGDMWDMRRPEWHGTWCAVDAGSAQAGACDSRAGRQGVAHAHAVPPAPLPACRPAGRPAGVLPVFALCQRLVEVYLHAVGHGQQEGVVALVEAAEHAGVAAGRRGKGRGGGREGVRQTGQGPWSPSLQRPPAPAGPPLLRPPPPRIVLSHSHAHAHAHEPARPPADMLLLVRGGTCGGRCKERQGKQRRGRGGGGHVGDGRAVAGFAGKPLPQRPPTHMQTDARADAPPAKGPLGLLRRLSHGYPTLPSPL